MLNLAEYRKKSQCLADFLPWAALVAESVVLNKDGSLQIAIVDIQLPAGKVRAS